MKPYFFISTVSLLFLASCNDNEKTEEKLVGDYELIGERQAATFYGSYAVYKDGRKVGLLELADEQIKFTTFDPDGRENGQIRTPIVTETDAGCMALIIVPDQNGGRETHQLIEEKIMGSELDPEHQVLRGSVIHGGPYTE